MYAYIPLPTSTESVILHRFSRQVAAGRRTSLISRRVLHRTVLVQRDIPEVAGRGGRGGSLYGDGGGVVDGLTDGNMPSVDQFELWHSVGVARRHGGGFIIVVGVFVACIVGRGAVGRSLVCDRRGGEEGGDDRCSGRKTL